MGSQKHFPVLGSFAEFLGNVPWDFVRRGEQQALANHNQTLERLAERGGLHPIEMEAAIRGKSLKEVRGRTEEEASYWLKEELTKYEQADFKKQIRSETLKEAAALFDVPKWLCLDHGGEEGEEIKKRILALDKP